MTAGDIFERAIALMDEGNSRGEMDTAETAGYKSRTLAILNILGEECREAAGAPEVWEKLDRFDVPLALDPGLAGEALPYGLAAHLFLEEDPAAANFFQQRYEALVKSWKKGRKAAVEEIGLPYGGMTAGEEVGTVWR